MKSKRKMMVFMLMAIPVALTVVLGVRWWISSSQPGHDLGVSDGRLAECPDRPNCVATQTQRDEQRMRPMSLGEEREGALSRLESIVLSMPRSRVVTATDNYLHAEFRSFLFGFVDDTEFFLDDANRVIHFRSASRLGHSDLGVNRSRMERIQRKFEGQ